MHICDIFFHLAKLHSCASCKGNRALSLAFNSGGWNERALLRFQGFQSYAAPAPSLASPQRTDANPCSLTFPLPGLCL